MKWQLTPFSPLYNFPCSSSMFSKYVNLVFDKNLDLIIWIQQSESLESYMYAGLIRSNKPLVPHFIFRVGFRLFQLGYFNHNKINTLRIKLHPSKIKLFYIAFSSC